MTIEEDDVLLNITGDSVARCCIVPNEVLPARVNQHVAIIRADKNRVNPRYLKYSLLYQKDTLLTFSEIGATRRALTKGMLESFEIPVPALPEQEAIAEVLSSLDDKIDLLHRNNKTLEQLAETVFRQWFVEDAEDQWDDVPLSTIATHIKQSVNPGALPNSLFYHYSLPAYDNGQIPEKSLGQDILSNKYRVAPGQVLISKLNPGTSRVWFILECQDVSICSTEFQVFASKKDIYQEFTYCLLKSNDTTDILKGAASGTSGSHQRVNPELICNLTFKMPPEKKITRFHEKASGLLEKVSKNRAQIGYLETLRDTLLPKLMSGAVKVNNLNLYEKDHW